jgi:hypothetical protein
VTDGQSQAGETDTLQVRAQSRQRFVAPVLRQQPSDIRVAAEQYEAPLRGFRDIGECHARITSLASSMCGRDEPTHVAIPTLILSQDGHREPLARSCCDLVSSGCHADAVDGLDRSFRTGFRETHRACQRVSIGYRDRAHPRLASDMR